MSESHSTAPARQSKPAKPYSDFPLFARADGRWAKKIRGKTYYFGWWDDPEGALKNYRAQKDDLHAGRKPRPDAEAVTVKDVANAFLNAKQAAVDACELSPRTWDDYKAACALIVSNFGMSRVLSNLHQEEFASLRTMMAKKWGPHRVGKTIQCVRCWAKYAYDTEMIPAPLRCGPGFARPSKKPLRLHRAKQGPKLFTAHEIHGLLAAASVQVKAMVLLGINCGFDNSDCASLTVSALDLDGAMIDFPRPKTGIARRCPLWPETVAALRAGLEKRPTPKAEPDAALVFITRCGDSWGTRPAAITHETKKLLGKLHINGHRNFYTLRHTFRTIADAARDQPAAESHYGARVAAHVESLPGGD